MLAPGVESISAKKIFVGGLSAQTTRELLISHFQHYGVIQECTLMQDRSTGRSRCFGFVTMRDKEVVERILSEEQLIDGKKTDCKHAVPKDAAQTAEATASFRTRKLFVGGLPPEVTLEEFREYFQQFGELEDSVVMLDRQTRKPRGFGFVTFREEEAVEEVLRNYNNNLLKGKWVECKKALPKDISPFQASSQPFYPSGTYFEYPYEDYQGDISENLVAQVLEDMEEPTAS